MLPFTLQLLAYLLDTVAACHLSNSRHVPIWKKEPSGN